MMNQTIWTAGDLGEDLDFRRYCHMGKGGGSAPAPDPAATAAAQAQANKEAVHESARVNQINEVTPWGDLTYSGTIGEPDRTRTTSNDPASQNLLNIQRQIGQTLAYPALSQAQQIPHNPFTVNGLPSLAAIRSPGYGGGGGQHPHGAPSTSYRDEPYYGGQGGGGGGSSFGLGAGGGGFGFSGGGGGGGFGRVPIDNPGGAAPFDINGPATNGGSFGGSFGGGPGRSPGFNPGGSATNGGAGGGSFGSGPGRSPGFDPSGSATNNGAFVPGTHEQSPPSTGLDNTMTAQQLMNLGVTDRVVGDRNQFDGFDLPSESSTTTNVDAQEGTWDRVPHEFTGGGGGGEGSDWGDLVAAGATGTRIDNGDGTWTQGGNTYRSLGPTEGDGVEQLSGGTEATTETTTTPGASAEDVNSLLGSSEEFRRAVMDRYGLVGNPSDPRSVPGDAHGPDGGGPGPNHHGQLPPGYSSGSGYGGYASGATNGGYGGAGGNSYGGYGGYGYGGGGRGAGVGEGYDPGQNELLNAAQPVEQATFDRFMQINRPEYTRARDDLANSLTTRGIPVGSEAWNRANSVLEEQQREYRLGAASEAVGAGRSEQSRLFGLTKAVRDQALQERLLERTQPINELAAALQGSPALPMPSFSPAAAYNVAPADFIGAQALQTQAQQGAANRRNATGNAAMGGLFGLGAAAISLSDRRLKRNITRISQTNAGVPLYRFNYRDSNEIHVGVMADELEQTQPEAVLIRPDGYKMVDYSKVA